MNKERSLELINAIIENLLVAEKNETVIKYLLYIGFKKEELIEVFNFSNEDVLDAEQSMDDYVPNIVL